MWIQIFRNISKTANGLAVIISKAILRLAVI